MLSTFFRPKWQHKDPAIRLQAVSAMTVNKDNANLITLALNDANTAVRHAAIAKLESLNHLKDVFNRTSHNSDKHFAQQCWCAVLSNADLTPAANAENVVLDCQDSEWLSAIACFSENESLRNLALTGLRDEQTIFNLLAHNHTRLWPALIEQLQTEAALKHAAQLVKGRDKKTTQLIRQRLEQLQEKAQVEQASLQHSQTIVQKLQHLIDNDHIPLFEGQLLNLQKQVDALTTEAPLYREIQTKLVSAQQKLTATQARELLQNQQADATAKAKALLNQLAGTLTVDSSFEAQFAELTQLDSTLKTAECIQLLKEIEQLHQASLQLAPILAAHEPLSTEQINKLTPDQAEKRLTGLQQAKALCQQHKALQKRYFSGLEQQEKLLKQSLSQQQQKHVDQRDAIEQLIDAADTAIAESDFAEVRRLYKKVKPMIANQGNAQRKHYQAALLRMQAATQALEDWKAFAADPKREALCEAMEKLIASDMHAPEKANEIKSFNEQWKALGYCQDQAIWQRFRDLSDKAYQPCKAYFDEQRQKKAFNAEQRRIICEQLEQFVSQLNWQQCDYRSIDKLYRQIDLEWQKYSLLEHKEFKALQERYNRSMQLIKDKLQQEKQTNLAKLEQIVSSAKALADENDANAALAQYQSLHEQWKQVGLTFHKPQQTLWQALREAGDAIYQKRNQQRVDAEETLQANLQQAQSLIEQIQNVEDATQLEALKESFNQIQSLPKNAVKRIRSEYQNALQQFQIKQSAQQQRAVYSQLVDVRSWAEQCALEEKQQGKASTAPSKTLPNAWQKVLEARLGEYNAELIDAQKLCIELEMLLEKNSPDQDSALRMQLQMAQLSQHFNQAGRHEFSERFIDLYLRWSAIAGGKLAGFDQLAARFNLLANSVIDA